MNKYIIALLALNPNIYADEAQKSFANIIDVYVAGPESYPHITLCQFYTDERSAELSVARKSNIVEFHNKIISLTKNHGIKSFTTGVGDLFRPHLTMARINKLQITQFNEQLLKKTTFALTLGMASRIGQYQKILKTYPAKMDN